MAVQRNNLFNLILRRPRSGRLEGWAASETVAILRDARKGALLRMRAEQVA
jgi:hypothetical protein